uniref:Ig-like domain-containing protein n=1 Tax=Poecilia latipinna TaxID=48699 RepID=A0A3B3U4S0_9TELE
SWEKAWLILCSNSLPLVGFKHVCILLNISPFLLEKHSLTVLVTASSGLPHFPDFIITTQVDKLPTSYCDSNKNIRANPKYGQKLMNIESQIADWYIEQCFEIMSDYLKVKMGILKDLNQSEAVHILQVIIGCEWEEKTKETTSFLQFGYNGADFMKFDPKKLTWIPQTPQAVSIKPKWEADESAYHLKHKDFLNHICPDWLKKYMANNQVPLQSTGETEQTPSSPIRCHVTGFYPNRGQLYWRENGEEIHEYVEHSEILPNPDGTFQMSGKAAEEEDAAVEIKFIPVLFPVSPTDFPSHVISGVVVGLVLLVALCISGFIFWKKNNNGGHNMLVICNFRLKFKVHVFYSLIYGEFVYIYINDLFLSLLIFSGFQPANSKYICSNFSFNNICFSCNFSKRSRNFMFFSRVTK